MNYYNEFDPAAATWLRELIVAKLIPQGEVDTRSIKDVRADDLRGFNQCHFFAGIGGWSRALQLAGWSEDRPVWTGSCPCQSFSAAGKQKGAEDERDLWPVFFDLIRSCRPEFVFGEQVEAAIKHGWLDRVCSNMEAEDYTVGAVVLGAHSVNAPHLRQRLYWGATRLAENSTSFGWRGRSQKYSKGEQFTIQAQGLGDDSSMGNMCIKRLSGWRRTSTEQAELSQHVSRPDSQCEQLADLSGNGYDGRDTDRQGKSLCLEKRRVRQSSRESNSFSVADTGEQGLQGRVSGRQDSEWTNINRHTGCSGTVGLSGLSSWSGFGLVYCRDNKVRRVPAESLFFGVADGISERMDEGRNCGVLEVERGFPLCKKEEEIGWTMLLKGYGNAIIPQVAAEFITAFREEAK